MRKSRSKSKGWPRLVKSGNVTVKVYRLAHKTTRSGFVYQMAWAGADGKRKLRQYADMAEALDEAQLKADNLADGMIEASEMKREDRDLLRAIREVCGDTPPLAAVEEWRQIQQIAGKNGIAAAREWAARRNALTKSATRHASKRA